MCVPEMYRFVMYYFQIPCTIDLQVTIPGIGGRGLSEKTFEKWMQIVHS